MSVNKAIIIFGIILLIIAAVISYQFSANGFNRGKNNQPTKTLTIRDHTFTVSTATSSAEQELGLTQRDSLPKEQGMLFLFEKEGYPSFWTRNMQFSIDIIFINNNQVVSFIEDAKPYKAEDGAIPTYQPEQPITSVLEINAGLIKEYGIKKGDSVTIK